MALLITRTVANIDRARWQERAVYFTGYTHLPPNTGEDRGKLWISQENEREELGPWNPFPLLRFQSTQVYLVDQHDELVLHSCELPLCILLLGARLPLCILHADIAGQLILPWCSKRCRADFDFRLCGGT